MSVTDTLVDFITASPAPAPDDARIVELCLLDWASVTLAGREEPVARIVRERAAKEGGRAEAEVCGLAQRLPARAAALVNGVTSHALDYDDTHFASLGHPSVTVIPAVVALADSAGASMHEVKQAVLIGAEVALRLGVWLGREHYRTGFHTTGTAGTFGAVAGAAKVMGLDRARTGMALGLAASLAGGVKAQFGTMAKPMHAGLAAAAGVDAARWVEAGLVAAEDGLESSQGFAATHHAAGRKEAFEGIGQNYLLPDISHKLHACCHGTHAMLEALGALRGQHNLTPENVVSVQICVHPQYLDICNIADPRIGLEAKFSFRQLAAMTIFGISTDRLDSFSDEVCQSLEMRAFRSRVEVCTDPSFCETSAQVVVETQDGGRHTGRHDLAEPVPMPEREQRLLAESAALIGKPRSRRLWSDISGTMAGNDRSPGEILLGA